MPETRTCAKCGAAIVRIERYRTTVVWEREDDGAWSCGALDDGTHFHLFCENEHEQKGWGRTLPPELQAVVYPGDSLAGARARSSPAIAYGAPHGKKEWDAYMAKFFPADVEGSDDA